MQGSSIIIQFDWLGRSTKPLRMWLRSWRLFFIKDICCWHTGLFNKGNLANYCRAMWNIKQIFYEAHIHPKQINFQLKLASQCLFTTVGSEDFLMSFFFFKFLWITQWQLFRVLIITYIVSILRNFQSESKYYYFLQCNFRKILPKV